MSPSHELTNEDIDTLMEALDAIGEAEHLKSILVSVMGSLAMSDPEQAAAKVERDRRAYKADDANRRVREEGHTLLKAKLIAMRPPVFVPEKV